MTVDSRPLNRVTRKDNYPTGIIQNNLDSFYGNQWFTTLDLFSGYRHIPIAEKDKCKTAFLVPTSEGLIVCLYEFNRMCFGLANAAANFVRQIDQFFGNIKRMVCLLYLDDFFIFSESYDEHLMHVEEVLQRLQSGGENKIK